VGHEVRGVVACGRGAAVRVEAVRVPHPGLGEALVAVQACGVCHTDLHYRQGGSTMSFPSCSGMRPLAWSKPWGMVWTPWRLVISSSSIGARYAVAVAPVGAASPGTASALIMPPSP